MFAWSPTRSSRSSRRYRVNPIEFDGYEQVVTLGVRSRKRSYELTFDRRASVVGEILEYLDSQDGKPFWFIDPKTGDPVLVRVDGSVDVQFNGSVRERLTCRFIETKALQPQP